MESEAQEASQRAHMWRESQVFVAGSRRQTARFAVCVLKYHIRTICAGCPACARCLVLARAPHTHDGRRRGQSLERRCHVQAGRVAAHDELGLPCRAAYTKQGGRLTSHVVAGFYAQGLRLTMN